MKKVLICDDSETDLLNLAGILQTAGCQVLKTNDSSQMISLVEDNQPDLVFLDIVMPEKDGYAICRELTNNEKTSAVPIIFVSSKGKKADRMWAQMQGAKSLVQKPYSENDILEQLAAF